MQHLQSSFRMPSVIMAAAILIVLAGMKYASSFISPLLLAFFISIILSQPVQWLVRRRVPLWLSIVIVLIAAFSFFFGMGQIIGSSFASFSQHAPDYAAKLNALSNNIFLFLNQQGIHISQAQLGHLFEPGKVMNTTATIIGELGGFLGNTLLVFFIIIFLLIEEKSFTLKATMIMGLRGESATFLHTIGNNIRHYLSIKTVISLMTGILIWIGLLIIGVDYAIVWGLIAFMLNYIPTIGSIIAGVPAVLLAVIQLGVGGAVWTLAVFLTVNIVIGSIVEPRMMGKGMNLSTLVVFISLIFWGYIFGTIGMFLSVPLTMAIKIIMEQKPSTRWVAVLLGTENEAKNEMKEEQTHPATKT